MVFGFLNINKPSGPTSHDIVAGLRKASGVRQVGHAGTLDPMAEGVLIVALGPATRLIQYLAADRKRYVAQIKLGVTTDTYDSQGEVVAEHKIPEALSRSDVEQALRPFLGDTQQIPPAYSAVKVGGKAAYVRARAGEAVELAPRTITIYRASILQFEIPFIGLDLECSAGTYVRSLAHDLGQALGCGAVLSSLVRTASGHFRIEDALEWERLETDFAENNWERLLIPPANAFPTMPRICISGAEVEAARHGRLIQLDGISHPLIFGYSQTGELVAVLRATPDRNHWHPEKVFIT